MLLHFFPILKLQLRVIRGQSLRIPLAQISSNFASFETEKDNSQSVKRYRSSSIFTMTLISKWTIPELMFLLNYL